MHNRHERDPTVDALSKVCQLTLFGIKMNTHVISFYKVESKVGIIASVITYFLRNRVIVRRQ